MKKFLTNIKNIMSNIFKGIFCEKTENDKIKFSLGRLMLIMLFTAAMVIWLGGANIPTTALTILLTLLSHNFGTKMIAAIQAIIKKR